MRKRDHINARTLSEAAGEAALIAAKPLQANRYKVQIAKVLVQRTILACG